MGLVGFQLVNGFLLRSDNLDDPSIIDSRWQCGDTAIDEGAGQLLMDWFQLHNGIFAGS
jgi:hypothetical protein